MPSTCLFYLGHLCNRLLCSVAVPHFEKMLYDQGQLANVYLDAFSITKNVFYAFISRDILDYLRRDMIGPDGEIYSAEDADSAESEGAARKKEGAFYVWSSKEVSPSTLISILILSVLPHYSYFYNDVNLIYHYL